MNSINEAFSPEESKEIYDKFLAIVSTRRDNLVKRYGKEAERIAYASAVNQVKKKATKEPPIEEPMDQEQKLKEMIQAALSKPLSEKKKSFPDLTGDGKVTKADILKGRGVIDEYESEEELIADEPISEDMDLGHTDNEPHMIKAELAQIGKYAMKLYKMVDQFENGQEVDFPAWWQAKITTAKNMISSAKHYLEFELEEPQIDAIVDVASQEDIINEYEDKTPKHKIVKQWVGPNSKFILATKPESEWDEKDYDLYNRLLKMVKDEGKIPSNLEEKLKPSMGAGAYVKDFRTSKAPQFKGKSKEKKQKMAVAAYLSAKDKIKEAVLAKLQESKGEYAKIEKEIADLKSKGKTLKDPEMVKLIKRRAELEKSKTKDITEGIFDRIKAKVKGTTSSVGQTFKNVGAAFKGDKEAIKDPTIVSGMAKIKVKADSFKNDVEDMLNDLNKLFPEDKLEKTPEIEGLIKSYKSLLDAVLRANNSLAQGKTVNVTRGGSQTQTAQTQAPTGGRARDERGRFVPNR